MKLIKLGNQSIERRVGGVFGIPDRSIQIASAGLLGGGTLVYLGGARRAGGAMGAVGLLGLFLSLIGGDGFGDGDGEPLFDEEDLSGEGEPTRWSIVLDKGNIVRFSDGVEMPTADMLELVQSGDEVIIIASGAARHGDLESLVDSLRTLGARVIRANS